MDVDHKSEMEDILNKAGFSELLQRFIAEKIEPETIIAVTDLDLIRLEVATIGVRVRLRETCRKSEKEPHQSDTNDNSSGVFEFGDTLSARNSVRLLLFQPRTSRPYRKLV